MKSKKLIFFTFIISISFLFFKEVKINEKIQAEEIQSKEGELTKAEPMWSHPNTIIPTLIEENNKTKLSFVSGSLKQNMVTNTGVKYVSDLLGVYGEKKSDYRPQIPAGNNWAVSLGVEGDVYAVNKNVKYSYRTDYKAIKAIAKDPKYPLEYEILLELDPIEGFYKTVKVTNLGKAPVTLTVAEINALLSTGVGQPGAYSLGKNQGFFLQSSDKKTSLLYRFRDSEGNPYGAYENYALDSYVNGWLLDSFKPKGSVYGTGQENFGEEGYAFETKGASVNFKTQPKTIGLNESIEAKVYMYFGEPNVPEITIDKKDYSVYKQDEKIDITGTIFDKDSVSSTLYTQYPDGSIKKENSISLEREVTKPMNYSIDVSKLEVGVNKLKVWAEDPMRINSKEIEVIVNVFEVTGTPNMKKVSIGSEFNFTPDDLVSDIKSLNPAISEISKIANTAKVGFDQAVVSLKDSIRTEQTKDILVPINIYGPNTLFDDANNLALDAQDIWLSQVKVQEATDLKMLIKQQMKPKSWDMITGQPYDVEVLSHNVKVAMDSYQAEIGAKNEKNQTIKKNVKVHVVGGTPTITSENQNKVVESPLGMDYKIEGIVLDQDSPNYTISYKLDQENPVEIVSQYDNTETYNQEVSFSGMIPKEKLSLGMHTLEVTIVDSEGNQAMIQFELNVKGELAFKQLPPESFSYPNAKISGKSELIHTRNPTEMIVEDYRGTETEWKMMGTLVSEMQDSQSKDFLKNSLVFIDGDGFETPFTLGEGILLAQGKTSQSNHIFPIKWEKEQGVLVRIPLGAKKGTYKGVLDTTLVDAP